MLTPPEFGALVQSQPWRSVWRWQDNHYQYAICEKGPVPPGGTKVIPVSGPVDPAKGDYSI